MVDTYVADAILQDLREYRKSHDVDDADVEYAIATAEYLMAQFVSSIDNTLGKKDTTLLSIQKDHQWIHDKSILKKSYELLTATHHTCILSNKLFNNSQPTIISTTCFNSGHTSLDIRYQSPTFLFS